MAFRGRGRGGLESREKPPRHSIKDFLTILKPYFWPRLCSDRIRAFSCFFFLGCSKACSIVAPLFLGLATDVLGGDYGERTFSDLALYVMLYIVFKFGVQGFNELQRVVYLSVKAVAYREVAVKTFRHVHSLSLHWHLTKRSGVVLKSMDRGITSANNVVQMLFLRLAPTVIEMVVLTVLFITKFDTPGAGVSVAVGFIIYVALTLGLTEWRRRIRRDMAAKDNEANDRAVDTLTNFETVKCFTAEEFEAERYEYSVKRFAKASRKTEASMSLLNVLQQLTIHCAMIGVMLFGGKAVLDGWITVGDFVALNAYVIQLFAPLSWLGSMYSLLINAFIDMAHLSHLLNEAPDVKDKPGAQPLRLENAELGAKVEFKNVRFSYPETSETTLDKATRKDLNSKKKNKKEKKRAKGGIEKETSESKLQATSPDTPASKASNASANTDEVRITVGDDASLLESSGAKPKKKKQGREILKGITFTIEPGTTTALVGHTGSGKSTISRLLFRFYDPGQGSVVVDGQNVLDITQKSLRRAIGIVPQDTVLFNDTIEANIRYGKQDATKEEVIAAARDAQLMPFIESLDEGFETKVGERGLKLSGGEKQRVAIARVLLKNPPILVLDEATSSLDTITEMQIQTAIASVREGRTAMVIAHRLSTIKDADQIIVLDKGEIVEKGAHDELLEQDGFYAGLWKRQDAARQGSSSKGSGEAGEEGEVVVDVESKGLQKTPFSGSHASGHVHGAPMQPSSTTQADH